MEDVRIRPSYRKIEGILFPMFAPEDCIREALKYKPKPEDVIIATYPKCGTTWMQMVALQIFRKGRGMEYLDDYHRLCPYLERKGVKGIENMSRPGAFKTHLPYTHVPYSPEAKYIYMLRNPKDCCVSMYFHTKGVYQQVYSEATFDDFFEIFMAGEVAYNDYFDHLASWYPHLKDQQVFFTTYEAMKEDLRDVVLRLSSFLGKGYVDVIQRDNAVLNGILHSSSFDCMKENLSDAFKPFLKDDVRPQSAPVGLGGKSNKPFVSQRVQMRKGIVGDWMNHFSEEQSERLNKKFVERTRGTEIFDMYKSYMRL